MLHRGLRRAVYGRKAVVLVLIFLHLTMGVSAVSGQCQLDKLVLPDFENVGGSVAITKESLILGANGAAFIYAINGFDFGAEQQVAPKEDVSGFGVPVAIADGQAFVSSDAGVHVFAADGTSWREVQVIPAPNPGLDAFGFALAVDGDVAIIGAPTDDETCPDGTFCSSGASYIFRRIGKDWVFDAKLTPSDPDALDFFGWSVAVDDDVAVVGTWVSKDAAYVFRFDGSSWTQEDRLTPFDAAEGDVFGSAVAVRGDVVAVGASEDAGCPLPEPARCEAGSVYVFRWNGDNWAEEQQLEPSDGAPRDLFGTAIGMDDDLILVGAWRDDHGGNDSGSAYLFRFEAGTWREQAKVVASDAEASDRFGAALGLSNGLALIGARFASNGQDNNGAAYVFGVSGDCNENSTPDSCDLVEGSSQDCNDNAVPDECDIESGQSQDTNQDGIPDECPLIPATSSWGLIVMALILCVITSLLLRYKRRLENS